MERLDESTFEAALARYDADRTAFEEAVRRRDNAGNPVTKVVFGAMAKLRRAQTAHSDENAGILAELDELQSLSQAEPADVQPSDPV